VGCCRKGGKGVGWIKTEEMQLAAHTNVTMLTLTGAISEKSLNLLITHVHGHTVKTEVLLFTQISGQINLDGKLIFITDKHQK
jgi:hypothetical protein